LRPRWSGPVFQHYWGKVSNSVVEAEWGRVTVHLTLAMEGIRCNARWADW